MRVSFVLVLVLVLFWACDGHHRPRSGVPELSGLVASRAHPGVFWAHGDSGNAPVLFALDEAARTLAEVRVNHASHQDWEDIALDSAGHLYIGDIGNNHSVRDDLAIHVLREPDPNVASAEVRPLRTIRFRYPDQFDAHGQRSHALDFDAEALFVLNDRLYLATKQIGAPRTTLYRVPLDGQGEVVLEKVAEFNLKTHKKQKGARVTAASASPDGAYVALLTYDDVLLFRVAGEHVLEGPIAGKKAPNVNGLEALTWDNKGLLLGSEGGKLVRVKVPTEPVELRD